MIFLYLLLLLFEVVKGSKQITVDQIKCRTNEYICGDECVSQGKLCICGSQLFPYGAGRQFVCCNTIPCLVLPGGVWCTEGSIQRALDTCKIGNVSSCKQVPNYGYTTLPCDDQTHCYPKFYSCQGVALCSE